MSNATRRVKYSFKNFDWVTGSFLILTPILAVITTYWHVQVEGFNPDLLWYILVVWLITGISVTAGYHRHFAHCAYKTNKFMQFWYLIFGATAFASSALKWSTNHHDHHKYADTDKDPHSYKEGFFHAHFGWMLFKFDMNKSPKYLTNNKLVMWQDRNFIKIAAVMNALIVAHAWYVTGNPIGAFAIAFFGRVVYIHHGMFFINSLCHFVGSREYDPNQTAVDNPIVAIVTLGEGYHNFHHTFQSDYRNGIKWYHFDPTKWFIKFLASIGFAWDLNTVSDAALLRAKMRSKQEKHENKLLKKFGEQFSFDSSRLEDLKASVQSMQMQIDKMKKEYKLLKKQKSDEAAAKLLEMKLTIKQKKLEFRASYQAWVNEMKLMMYKYQAV